MIIEELSDTELLEEYRIACELLNVIGFTGAQFDTLHALENEVIEVRKLKPLPITGY